MEVIYNNFEPFKSAEGAWVRSAISDLGTSRDSDEIVKYVALGAITWISGMAMIAAQPIISIGKSLYTAVAIDLDAAASELWQGLKNEIFFIISSLILPIILAYGFCDGDDLFDYATNPASSGNGMGDGARVGGLNSDGTLQMDDTAFGRSGSAANATNASPSILDVLQHASQQSAGTDADGTIANLMHQNDQLQQQLQTEQQRLRATSLQLDQVTAQLIQGGGNGAHGGRVNLDRLDMLEDKNMELNEELNVQGRVMSEKVDRIQALKAENRSLRAQLGLPEEDEEEISSSEYGDEDDDLNAPQMGAGGSADSAAAAVAGRNDDDQATALVEDAASVATVEVSDQAPVVSAWDTLLREMAEAFKDNETTVYTITRPQLPDLNAKNAVGIPSNFAQFAMLLQRGFPTETTKECKIPRRYWEQNLARLVKA